jgi:hypothetical protein
MKKTLLLLLIFLLFNFASRAYANPDFSKGIERSIVTNIEWDDGNKIILIHSILVKKFLNQPIFVDSNFVVPVRAESLKNKTITNKEARDFVVKVGGLFGVDHIFGQNVNVFKDFSEGDNVTQDDINKAKEDLKIQIERDWSNPPPEPSIWQKVWAWISALKGLLLLFVALLLIAIRFFFQIK